MNDQLKKEIVATYDDDKKRMHRFIVDEAQGITGSIYIPKDEEVPDILIVKLRAKAEVEKEKTTC